MLTPNAPLLETDSNNGDIFSTWFCITKDISLKLALKKNFCFIFHLLISYVQYAPLQCPFAIL